MNEPIDASLELHAKIRALASAHARLENLTREAKRIEAELKKAEVTVEKTEEALEREFSGDSSMDDRFYICGEWVVQIRCPAKASSGMPRVDCSRVEVVDPADPRQASVVVRREDS